MNEHENPVIETENVEATTEETTQVDAPEKVYTEEDFRRKLDEAVGKRLSRREAKIRKEYEDKYGDLENVLRAGTGIEDAKEMTDSFREFYESKGVQIPERETYSERDIKILARAEADDIIKSGMDEVIEESDRLAGIGIANMSAREKEVFRALAEHRQAAEKQREFSELGVPEDVYGSEEFKEFASKFNSNTPAKEIFDIYNKMKPKKEIRTMGSMKQTEVPDTGVKDFYSYEEAVKFSKEDFDKNPELYKAVQKSMLKW